MEKENENFEMPFELVETKLNFHKTPVDEAKTKFNIRPISEDEMEMKLSIDLKDILDMPLDDFVKSIGISEQEFGRLFNQWIDSHPQEALELLDFLHDK